MHIAVVEHERLSQAYAALAEQLSADIAADVLRRGDEIDFFALSDYFACVMARLTPEQVQQMNVLRGALMDAILAENASREAKNNEGRTEP